MIKDGPHKGLYVAAQLTTDLDSLPQESAVVPPSNQPAGEPAANNIKVESAETPSESTTTTTTITTTTTTAITTSTTTTTLPAATTATPPKTLPEKVPVSSSMKGIVVAKTAVNIRSIPKVTGRISGSAAPGIALEIEPAATGWYKIKSGINKDQYISAQFLKIESEAPVAAPVVTHISPSEPAAAPAVATNTAAATASTTATTMAPAPTTTLPAGQHNPDWNDQKEKLFQEQVERAFKKKKVVQEAHDVIMPVFFENRATNMGQMNTRVQEGAALTVEATTLFKMLKLLVAQSWFNRPEIIAINPEVAKNGQELASRRWVSLDKFDKTGIQIQFHPDRLEIMISVPPELRAPSVASILKSNDINMEDSSLAEPAAGFSSYLNINASEVIDTRYEEFKDRRAPLRAQLENGTNIGGVVMEAYGRYLEDRSGGTDSSGTGFARGDVRMVKDFPDKILRTTVGDLVYPTQGFQTFRQMAGVSVTSQFSMAKSKLTYPTGNYEIFLQRPSKVYVWVNDQLQQVLDLPAGRHSLRDFPFANGVNDLRLEIVDDVGREETQRYSYFSSTELLRPELHQFNYAVGTPATDNGNIRTYDSDNTTISAFHRYGLYENLTIGANIQSDKLQSVAGFEALMSTSVGYFKLEPAISILNGDTGGAVQAKYTYSDYKGEMKTQRVFNLGIFHGGTTFSPLGMTGNNVSRKTFEISSGYTQGFNRTVSGNVSAAVRYFSTPNGPQDSFTLSLGANKKFDNGLSLSSSLTHTKLESGTEDLSLFAFLLWSFPKEKQIVTAIHNTTDDSSRLDWSYNPSTGADSSTYGASLRDGKTDQGYSGQILHDGNRVRAALSHEVIVSKETDPQASPNSPNSKKPTSHVTSLQLGTSIAYAGGHFAVGRPVTDSFAIIAPVKNLKGQRLDVNPLGEESYTAKSDFWGSALLPELGSYSFTDLNVSGRKLPAELAVPKDHFSIYPGYKSGYAFEIGTDATIYLVAQIIGPDGKPLSLAAGTAFYLDGKDEPPVTVFTNKKGTLRSEGFKPGRYRLEIATESFKPIEITIPETAKDSYDIGTLKLLE